MEEIVKVVRENHSYEVPEVISHPLEQGNPAYLSWISENTKKKAENEAHGREAGDGADERDDADDGDDHHYDGGGPGAEASGTAAAETARAAGRPASPTRTTTCPAPAPAPAASLG